MAAQSDRVVNIAVTKAEHPVREVSIVVTGSGAKVPVEAGAFEYPEPPAGLDRRRKLQ